MLRHASSSVREVVQDVVVGVVVRLLRVLACAARALLEGVLLVHVAHRLGLGHGPDLPVPRLDLRFVDDGVGLTTKNDVSGEKKNIRLLLKQN
jgi:hypothetical protein